MDISKLSDSDLESLAAGNISAMSDDGLALLSGEKSTAKESSFLGDLAAGAIRGAGSIGATILTPFDMLAKAAGIQNDFIGRDDRREKMDSALSGLGADTNSIAFKSGKIGTEIAGTLGAGGAITKLPGMSRFAPSLLSSIQSGGFSLGKPAATTLVGKAIDAGTRAAGSAIYGGAASGLIDPETASTGATIGAIMPGAVSLAGKAGSYAGGKIAAIPKQIVGNLTGVGDEAVSTAYQAGKKGNQTFLDNLRRNVDMTDVLTDVKSMVGKLRELRSAEYKQSAEALAKDKSILDFTPIIGEVSKIKSLGSYKGQVVNKNAAGVVDDLVNQIDEWAKLPGNEFHTPEGMDALKRAIGDIRDSTQFGTPARKAANDVYNVVKNQIVKQAPVYAKTMKQYSEASKLINEIERALSTGEKASADTAMRKLQSLMRNNVQTNYGNRLRLVKEMEEKAGKEVLPALAGQAMSSAMPRGLARLEQAALGLGGVATMNPALLAALPMTSPRLMGEAAYKLGQWAGLLGKATNLIPMPNLLTQQSPALYGPLLNSAGIATFSRP